MSVLGHGRNSGYSVGTEKKKSKHSCHRVTIAFQAKQTLNLGREKLANVPSSSK